MPPAAIFIGGALVAGAAARKDRKSAEKANETAERQRDESIAFIREQTERARGDIFKLFPEAQESRRQGIQTGLDIFRQTIPLQQQLFQQGNIGAQQALIQGFPSVQNAILGRPVDFDPQAVTVGQGLGFDVPQAPEFAPIQSAEAAAAQQGQAIPQQGPQGLQGPQFQQSQLTPEQIRQIQQLGPL